VYLELDCICLAKIRPTVHRGERGRRGQQHRGWGRRSGAGRQVGHLAASTALPVGIAAALVLFELRLLYQQQRPTASCSHLPGQGRLDLEDGGTS
jgi:hypothetical protein